MQNYIQYTTSLDYQGKNSIMHALDYFPSLPRWMLDFISE